MRGAAACVPVLLLVVTAVAYSAAATKYAGRTNQHQPISFTVAGGYVRHLSYHIIDNCPAGRSQINDFDKGFTPIRISKSKFGGTFVDHHNATKAVVSGTVSEGWVRGTLRDAVPYHGVLCHGRASYSLHPA